MDTITNAVEPAAEPAAPSDAELGISRAEDGTLWLKLPQGTQAEVLPVGSVVAITIHDNVSNWQIEQLKDRLESASEIFRGLNWLVLGRGASLQSLDEQAMAAMGWVRKT